MSTSQVTIKTEFAEQPLMFDRDQLKEMTKRHSDQVIDLVPGFRYWEVPQGIRGMERGGNIVGHQQRAWDFYWSIRCGAQRGSVVIGVGTGGVGAPCQLTTDKYNGTPPPDPRYDRDGTYGYSMQALDADASDWPYFDGKMGGVIFNHSFEHVLHQAQALHEALRVTENGGCVCILMPDVTYCGRGMTDPTHTREFSADEFIAYLETIRGDLPSFQVVAHNTLLNNFSFDTVLQRT